MNKNIKRSRYPFMDPKVVMSVVVTLIILAVGVFAFFVTTGALNDAGITTSGTQSWTISSPSNPETLSGLPSSTTGISSVTEYFNDGTSATISSSDYVWSANTPTQIDVNITGGG